MGHTKRIALRCRIAQGGFSGERVIYVPKAEGGDYRGLAPVEYCWTRDERQLAPGEPPPGQQIDGLVAARRLEQLPGNRAVVTTPDGEVFVVPAQIISPRPEVEPAPDVPVGS